MPPPLTNKRKISPIKGSQNGHMKHRYPDSSHDIYSPRPGPSRYPYHDRPKYLTHAQYGNSNGHSDYHRHIHDAVERQMSTHTGERIQLVNGNIPYHHKSPPSGSNSVDDSGEIINVDEEVDLERMYLDLITEEYTATVKRYVQVSIIKVFDYVEIRNSN